ncbi:MAG TPA: pyridoxamine 5'-phosphate oxidase family protein [Alphaproteobacteria bacterium]|nr:pyridoxamine 5'-phosphate oxidase family protein [Alphaproteobacteria bacterium]
MIQSIEELTRHYAPPRETVILKQVDRLDEHCRAFIDASPLVMLATSSPSHGVDCSPRGDQPGFVEVADDKTLLLPDRRGNNRIDSLRNIVENPAVGLLFLVPGVTNTFRVNGRARISVDPVLLARFAVNGKPPKSVLVITVDEAFIQCARALIRSELWNPARHIDRASLPSAGTVLAAHTGKVDAAAYDEEARTRIPETLY